MTIAVSDLISELKTARKRARQIGEIVDVRLCVDGADWQLRTGDVSYDDHHSELCAASAVSGDLTDDEVRACAEFLIEEIEAMRAMARSMRSVKERRSDRRPQKETQPMMPFHPYDRRVLLAMRIGDAIGTCLIPLRPLVWLYELVRNVS